MKNIQLAVKLFLVAAALTTFSCKKDDSTDSINPETRLPKNTSLSVVSILNDYTGDSITYKVGSLKHVTQKNAAASDFIPTISGSRKLSFTVNGQTKEFTVTIDSNAIYTAVIYGSAADPKLAITRDDTLRNTSETTFQYRTFNGYDSSGVSATAFQAYYPGYDKWGTAPAASDNVSYGSYGLFSVYTAGIAASWRIVEAGSETGTLGAYKTGATNVLYTPSANLSGEANKHLNIYIYGKDATIKSLLVYTEDLVQ